MDAPDESDHFGLGAENVRVYVRIRPSQDPHARVCAFAANNTTIKLDSKVIGVAQHATAMKGDELPKSFTVDYVASPQVSQESFFEKVGRPMAEFVLSGYNGTIFAYGQTGSGKTYTIQGPSGPHRSEDKGLTVRILEYIFRKLTRAQRASPNFQFICECSYLELYQEVLRDLLADETKKLDLREDLKKGVYVDNMTKIPIQSAEEAEGLFLCGAKKRHVAFSKANDQSSRSHAIFTIYIQTQEVGENGMTAIKSSMLHIVDLAGSERQKNTEATGTRLQEAGTINKSLTHLGKTIRALVDKAKNKKVHVSYRESKLTFLLKQSLGGNSKTAIIATVNPGLKSYGETLSTLRFADRAKMIQNNAVINESNAGTLATMQVELKRLQLENQQLKQSYANAVNGTSASSTALSLNGVASYGMGPNGGGNISPRYLNGLAGETASSPIEIERDERILQLEEAFRMMEDRLQKAMMERDNYTLKVLDLQRLLLAKQSYGESYKLIARLREDKIKRIQRCGADVEYAASIAVSDEEVASLKEEIEALRFQRDHHPDVLKLSIENFELKEILEQYEAYYSPDGEIQQLRALCAKLSGQFVKLSSDKAKLIALLNSDANVDGTTNGSLAEAWQRDVNFEALEAEIERVRAEALEQLSAIEKREMNLMEDLAETRQQLVLKENELQQMFEAHEQEKAALEAHYCSLSETIRDKYEREIKALYDKLEHAHVSSVTVLTMEKQLSEQTDEYILMKKFHFDIQSDLKALERMLETSYKVYRDDEDDRDDDEDESNGGKKSLANRYLQAKSNLLASTTDESEDEYSDKEEAETLVLSTPKKSGPGTARTPAKSPWTPGRGTSTSLLTPSSRSGLTPGRPTMSIPRLAIAKLQELHAIVADYTSKISELENDLAKIDGVHLAVCKGYQDQIAEDEEVVEALRQEVTEYQDRESASREKIESLESELDINVALVEEKELEAEEMKKKVQELTEVVGRLENEKVALASQSNVLLTQLKQQKDEQVLAMMKRQDEVENELVEVREVADREARARADFEAQLASSLEQCAATELTLSQTRSLVDSLTNKCSEKDHRLEHLEREFGDLQADRDNLVSRLGVLEGVEETVQGLKRENDDLTSAAKESCRALREKQNQLQRLEDLRAKELVELEQEQQMASRAFEALQEENDQLAMQLNRAHGQLKKQTAELTASQTLASGLQVELTKHQALLQDSKQHSASLESQLRAEHVKNAQLTDAKESLAVQLSSLSAALGALTMEYEECKESLIDKSQQLQTIINEGTTEEHLLRDERQALLEQIAKHESEIESLTNQIETNGAQVFQMKEQFADAQTELQAHIKELESKLSSTQRNSEAARLQFQESDGQNLQEIGNLRRQLKEASLKREEDKKQHLAAVEALRMEMEALRVDKVVKAKDEEIKALKAELQATLEEMEALREDLGAALENANEASSELTSAKMVFADLASQKNGKIKYMQMMKSECNELQKQVKELTARLAEATHGNHLSKSAPISKDHYPHASSSSTAGASGPVKAPTPAAPAATLKTGSRLRPPSQPELTDLTNKPALPTTRRTNSKTSEEEAKPASVARAVAASSRR